MAKTTKYMLLLLLRILVDTAALVLIWLVQLVIYPAFLYSNRTDFQRWHPTYTRRVTTVVLPIMLSQVVVYGLALLQQFSWDVVFNSVLIAFVWAVTFFSAVPLHQRLGAPNQDHAPLARRLVGVNWYRTVLWTIVFVVSTVSGMNGALPVPVFFE